MSFLDYIVQMDKDLLILLNNLGSEYWDSFWLNVTNKYAWIPLYITVLILFVHQFGWKKTLFTLLMIALLVVFTDQFVNLIKETFHRLRPSKDDTMVGLIRVLKNSGGYSFVSGHAANSFAVTTFIIYTFKEHFKLIRIIIIWPLLFAYSRIYLGVHYPLDVISGCLVGFFIGWGFYKINQILLPKIK